jgi:hypothetical protein
VEKEVARQLLFLLLPVSLFEKQSGMDVKNTRELVSQRRLQIIKRLQDRESKISLDDLAKEIGCERRTVERDLKALREGCELFGSSYKMKTTGRGKRFFKSSAHPLTLALNLTEVSTLLKLIDDEYAAFSTRDGGHDELGAIYRTLFDMVYGQLTDYAKGIVRGADGSRLKLAKQWEGGAAGGGAHWRNEEEVVSPKKPTRRLSDMVHYLIKRGEPVTVLWRDKGGKTHEKHDVRVVGCIDTKKIKIRTHDGKEKSISIDKNSFIFDYK